MAKTEKPFFSDDLGKLLLRIAVGGLLLFHGVGKLTGGVERIRGMLASSGLPEFVAFGVYVGEVIAPALVLAGVLTRPAALVIAFNMLMAVYLAHSNEIFDLTANGTPTIELALFFFLGALALFFAGGGRFGLRRGQGRWE